MSVTNNIFKVFENIHQIELYNRLKYLVNLIEGILKVDKNIKEKTILNENNIYFIIHQLHLQKLISSTENIVFIKEKSQNEKENIISILFGIEESEKVKEWFNRIDEQINDWNKFKNQRDIDNQNIGEYGPAKYLNPELIQNLTFSEENEDNYNYEIFELIELNKENNKNINEIIKKLKNILNKWAEIFKADYEFLIGGSLMLEVNTKNSDIDAIYVVKEDTNNEINDEMGGENNDGTKQLISRNAQFFGHLNSKCLDDKKENCSDLSFFCHLCLQVNMYTYF
uniref:Uncharacterized protein n=1 Tax=Meloidogyne enterolobii TaxID=390850 RepID=A0A6V7WH76_MELEN|nr:unnamed protein product [Meloidogyne enterolobii]